jgi:hypothetical protein
LLKNGDYSKFAGKCESIPTALSELIRTAFIPAPGYKFICVDFSSIERVVLAWLAGEGWVLQAYAEKKDLYAATASQMFHVPIEQIAKGSEFRQKGKIGDLACIAQGELVLTDQGLTPIEGVTLKHKLWDGETWVEHNGIVNRGIRKVIEYDGLRATTDHLVWVEGEEEPIYFGITAACGADLVQTGQPSFYLAHRESEEPQNYSIDGVGSTILAVLLHGCDPQIVKRVYTRRNNPGRRDSCIREEKKLARYLGKTQFYDIRNAGSYATEVSPQRIVSIKKTREQLAKEYALVRPTPPPLRKLPRLIITKTEPPQNNEAADIGGFLLTCVMAVANNSNWRRVCRADALNAERILK